MCFNFMQIAHTFSLTSAITSSDTLGIEIGARDTDDGEEEVDVPDVAAVEFVLLLPLADFVAGDFPTAALPRLAAGAGASSASAAACCCFLFLGGILRAMERGFLYFSLLFGNSSQI